MKRAHRNLLAAILAVLILLIFGVGGLIYRSWAKTANNVNGFIADPGREFTPGDFDTFMHYLVGDFSARPPWHDITLSEEHALIVASLRQIELRGDPSVFILLITSWQHYHDFRELPALTSAFLERRDAAASMALVYFQGNAPGVILDETRARALIVGTKDERFQVALIVMSSPSVFAKTTGEYITLRADGLLQDKAWDTLRRRMTEERLDVPP